MRNNVVSRTSAYLYRLAFSYIFLLVGMVRGIVLIPLYLEHISVELYGAWLATGDLLAYLVMLDFGFTAVVQQQVAQQYGKKALQRVASISGLGILIGIGLSGIVGVLGYYLASYAPGFAGVAGSNVSILATAISIQSISIALMLVAYFTSGVLIALQRTAVNASINLLTMIIEIATTICGLNWG